MIMERRPAATVIMKPLGTHSPFWLHGEDHDHGDSAVPGIASGTVSHGHPQLPRIGATRVFRASCRPRLPRIPAARDPAEVLALVRGPRLVRGISASRPRYL